MTDYDCIGADFLVMQSFLDMLDSEHEDASSVDSQEMCEVDTPSQPEMPIARDIHVDSCSVQLARSASVASAFGGLMYEILISRPEIAAAVGAFAVGVVSHMVIDTGIEHGGAVQVITRYLQDVRACSSRDAHVCLSLERIQMHAHSSRYSVGVG